MTVEAKIKELLEASQSKKLNESSTGDGSTKPRQGSSQDASYTDLGNLDNQAPSVATSKDSSKSAKASTSGNGSTKPKQGDSKDATYDDLDDMKSGQKASAKMSKDTTMSPKIKGDATNDMQGSSKKATYSEDKDFDEEDFEDFDEDEIDEEVLDELSKQTLGSYVNKASRDASMASFRQGKAVGNAGAYHKRPDKEAAKKNAAIDLKREKGISRAVKKLTKENAEAMGLELSEEELDELSKKTLGSYVNKATTDAINSSYEAGRGGPRYRKNRGNIGNAFKREKSIATAVKKLTKEELDNISSLFGSEISEEVQTKTTEIFEAAVIARVNEEIISLEEQYNEAFEQELNEAIEQQKEELVEKVDSYMNYIVDQWLQENKVEVEQSLKLEAMDSFMEGLKTLFVEHYIEVPEEKVDVVQEMQSKIDELEDRLNEEINKAIESNYQLVEERRLNVVEEITKGLADTEIERFGKLIKGIDFINEESYAEKLKVIRQNHFNTKLEESQVLEDSGAPIVQPKNNRISSYAEAISRTVKK